MGRAWLVAAGDAGGWRAALRISDGSKDRSSTMTRRHDDEDDEALDRDGNRAILPDGMRLKVPLVSMDRAPPGFDPSRHRPGYRTVANCSDEVAMATLNEFLAHR